ncbi:unnamed protein product, partial [Didymodactylos carnosus]
EFETKEMKDLWFQRLNSLLQSSIERCRIVVDYNYVDDQNGTLKSCLIRKIIGISPNETTRNVINIDVFHLKDLVIDNYVLLANCIGTTIGTIYSLTSNYIPLIDEQHSKNLKQQLNRNTATYDFTTTTLRPKTITVTSY